MSPMFVILALCELLGEAERSKSDRQAVFMANHTLNGKVAIVVCGAKNFGGEIS
jgi:hypothetical protein